MRLHPLLLLFTKVGRLETLLRVVCHCLFIAKLLSDLELQLLLIRGVNYWVQRQPLFGLDLIYFVLYAHDAGIVFESCRCQFNFASSLNLMSCQRMFIVILDYSRSVHGILGRHLLRLLFILSNGWYFRAHTASYVARMVFGAFVGTLTLR